MNKKIFFFDFYFFFISCQSQKNSAIKPNVFGFATSNTFTFCDIQDTSFTNKIINLNPQTLRFPGELLVIFIILEVRVMVLIFWKLKNIMAENFQKGL